MTNYFSGAVYNFLLTYTYLITYLYHVISYHRADKHNSQVYSRLLS